MSVEWWNLDQALMWTAMRDMNLVDEAGGHPSNQQERDGSWYLFWISTDDIDTLDEVAAFKVEETSKLVKCLPNSPRMNMADWECLLLHTLARGAVSALDCTDGFPLVHPAWFIGASVDCSYMERDNRDRVNIARVTRYLDGEKPYFGQREVKTLLLDGTALRNVFPSLGEMTEHSSSGVPPSPIRLGGRPPKHDPVLLVSIAAALVHNGLQPKTQADLRRQSLEAYEKQTHAADVVSEEWAKKPIRVLWNALKLDERL